MRRRKLRWMLVGLAVLLPVVGAFVTWQLPDRITDENFGLIRPGMSRAEVEAILGPPRDCSSGPLRYARRSEILYRGSFLVEDYRLSFWETNLRDEPVEGFEWRSDSQIVNIYFDPPGIVYFHRIDDVVRMDQAPVENFFWRAKRQWRKWFLER